MTPNISRRVKRERVKKTLSFFFNGTRTSTLDLWLCAFIDKNDVKYNSQHRVSSCYVTERGRAFPVRRRGSFRDVHSSSAANMPKVQRTAYPSLFVRLSYLFSSFKLFSQSYLTSLKWPQHKETTVFLFFFFLNGQ